MLRSSWADMCERVSGRNENIRLDNSNHIALERKVYWRKLIAYAFGKSWSVFIKKRNQLLIRWHMFLADSLINLVESVC